jgi:mannose-6-phosphate isomerase-like protein (cupin superfamily)
MSDVTVKRIDAIEPYKGPGTLEGIQFRSVGRALGVTAWGMGVLTLAPSATTYYEHDHVRDGQEEAYLLLEGSATLRAGGEEWRVEPGMIVRVGPAVTRKWLAGDRGATLLAIGGTPGKAYVPRK